MSADPLHDWLAAEQCKQVVLQFMALFDARDWVGMESCVTAAIEWQRPDQTVRGLEPLRHVLLASPPDVRVRHVITNLRAASEGEGRIVRCRRRSGSRPSRRPERAPRRPRAPAVFVVGIAQRGQQAFERRQVAASSDAASSASSTRWLRG
jgi:hypothetical protein